MSVSSIIERAQADAARSQNALNTTAVESAAEMRVLMAEITGHPVVANGRSRSCYSYAVNDELFAREFDNRAVGEASFYISVRGTEDRGARACVFHLLDVTQVAPDRWRVKQCVWSSAASPGYGSFYELLTPAQQVLAHAALAKLTGPLNGEVTAGHLASFIGAITSGPCVAELRAQQEREALVAAYERVSLHLADVDSPVVITVAKDKQSVALDVHMDDYSNQLDVVALV